MTKEELVEVLRNCYKDDPEEAHIAADRALLEFINDPQVTKLFKKIEKWYA
jgi:hypothetical protein